MFSSEAWLANPGANFYNGVATQSLRFDRPSTPYLVRTPSSASNRKTWTWSGWFKTSTLSVDHFPFFSCGASGSSFTMLFIEPANDRIAIYDYDQASTTDYGKHYSVQIRDPSAWYHIQYAVDTTQSTASDRLKVYLNGTQLTSPYATEYGDMPLNYDTEMNTTTTQYIGKYVGNAKYADGYLSEVNFVDGTQLAPTSFGETKNGVWIPIKYSGSYGTNGYRLQFKETGVGTASTSTIGADTSGNTNHLTSSGIVASDCNMPDSPENNFPTLNPLVVGRNDGGGTYSSSDGNLRGANASGTGGWAMMGTTANIQSGSGKWYFECHIGASGDQMSVGIQRENTPFAGAYVIGYGSDSNGFSLAGSGKKWNAGGTSGTSYTSALSAGDIIGVLIDSSASTTTLTFYKNNSTLGTAFSSISGSFMPALSSTSGSANCVLNFGQDSSFIGNKTAQGNADANGIGDFYYAPPSGYLALCTSNLEEPTIGPNSLTQADDHFNTVLHTANGSAGSFTGVGFQPDWIWAKSRNNSYAHELWDSNRGVNSTLQSNSTSAEITTANRLVSFDSDGFSYGTSSNLYPNGATSVAWNWKANGGTTSSNTDGSITSTVQANTTSGFSIVTATSPSSGTWSVGHGLSKKPDMIIQKYRSGTSRWTVWHNILTSGQYLGLNETSAIASSGTPFNFNITDSVIGGNIDYDNGSQTVVYYVFHNVEGYSRFGSYTGNGNADGTFVHLGFRPAWLMVKLASGSGENWHMFDSTRATSNVIKARIIADGSSAENSNDSILDFTSNGFKFRENNAGWNGSGNTYIYMAFAEAPFKYANAR